LKKAFCFRILQQYDPDKARQFVLDYDAKEQPLIRYILHSICPDGACVVLRIDEINKVYSTTQDEFKELINLIGSQSCSTRIFFVPILSGTVIGPIKDIVSSSMHPPWHIPLPLLSLDSCANILKAKIPELDINNSSLKQLISDVGGHCRAFEFLYDACLRYDCKMLEYWTRCSIYVCDQIQTSYKVDVPALGKAIAYSFLSHPVQPKMPVVERITFLDLEESGVIKLVSIKRQFYVHVPFVFVLCHLQ
jgi:hypothetical protein